MFLLFLACFQDPQHNWVEAYDADPQTTLSQLDLLEDSVFRESVLLQLIEHNPRKGNQICSRLRTKPAQKKCKRFQERPHLWTLKEEDVPAVWSEGFIEQRLLFPNLDVSSLKPSNHCKGDRGCVEELSTQLARSGKINEAGSVCYELNIGRGRSDCLFHAAEQAPSSLYPEAVDLCVLSKGYGPECHNHLLLKAVSENQIKPSKHLDYVALFHKRWSKEYAQELEAVYWSMFSTRIVGTIQPFDVNLFKDFPSFLMPHIRSAVALRVVSSQDPIGQGNKALLGGPVMLPKVPGPMTPNFNPKAIYREEGVYFCDLRGGKRPVLGEPEADFILALIYAAHMNTGEHYRALERRILKEYPQIDSKVPFLSLEQ